ncbi:MAG: hypothetical protein MUF01_18810 [Bryobacterales bacterium]|jgi:hypothetical protein|nr:hypothetical protein [Bryobacterales bacterium]
MAEIQDQPGASPQELALIGLAAFVVMLVALSFALSAHVERTKPKLTSHVMVCPDPVWPCDVGADREAALVIMAYENPDLAEAVQFVEGHRIENLRTDLILAGKLVSIPNGTGVTELQRSPLNVTGKPRFSVVRIEEGKYAGNTVWAVADQVIPRPPR